MSVVCLYVVLCVCGCVDCITACDGRGIAVGAGIGGVVLCVDICVSSDIDITVCVYITICVCCMVYAAFPYS